MKIRKMVRLNQAFFFVNLLVLAGVVGFTFFDWNSDGVIEANRIVLKGESGTPNIILQGDDQNTLLTLNDQEGNVRLQLQGGVFPAIIMKSEEGEIVGTFFPLRDGGGAIGLGDRMGNMATFIRGGSTPMMNFYQGSNEPNIAMGIANDVPHFVMVPKGGQEGIVIHGSTPTTLLFVDEEGGIPVSLSRYGLYLHKEEDEEETQGTK